MPEANTSERTPEPAAWKASRPRLVRAAGIAGLLVPVVWTAIVALELSQGQVSHSLVSRPERFFGALDSRWFAVLLVAGAALLGLQLLLVGGVLLRAERRRVARAAFAVASIAAAARYGVSLLAPDPHLYGVSQARGLAALVLLACLPAALVLVGAALGGRGRALAWLSAILAVAMVWMAADWTIWSLRSGALQPQLWAVEPVEGLAAAWCALAGLWLLGLPESLRSRPGAGLASRLEPGLPPSLRQAAIPGPGRKASVALAVVAIAGLVGVSSPFVRDYEPTIAAQLTGRTQVETIHVGDIDRTYRVYRPVRAAAHPGLVFILHGVFGDGFIIDSNSGFDAQADRLGWIAVYPDGVADGWDAFGSGPTWGQHPGADDVAFISAAIDRLEATDAVDPDRVYVTGLSRGAMMTYRLGCELSDRVAAIAPVSGNMATADGSVDVPCNLDRPVSVLAIHGTADGTIPIAGGKTDILFSPLVDVIARWRALDSCAGTQTVAVDGASTTTSWACRGGSTVAMRVVTGGWHTWPVRSSSPVPTNPDDFDASRLIADFFVAHPLVAGGG
jgi:polyhydroxybutyrate depolymerase